MSLEGYSLDNLIDEGDLSFFISNLRYLQVFCHREKFFTQNPGLESLQCSEGGDWDYTYQFTFASIEAALSFANRKGLEGIAKPVSKRGEDLYLLESLISESFSSNYNLVSSMEIFSGHISRRQYSPANKRAAIEHFVNKLKTKDRYYLFEFLFVLGAEVLKGEQLLYLLKQKVN